MYSDKTDKRHLLGTSAAFAALALLLVFTAIFVSGDTGMPAGGDNLRPGLFPINGNSSQAKELGLCPLCYVAADSSSEVYVECRQCFEFVPLTGQDFVCGSCGAELSADVFPDRDKWLYHSYSECESLIWYPWFVSYNSGDGSFEGDMSDLTMIVEIKCEFQNGAFNTPQPWYSYEVFPYSLTANIDGEYAVYVFDEEGERLAVSRFDTVDKTRALTDEGYTTLDGQFIPVEIFVRFKENSAKIAIMKGDEELYSRNVSKHAPTVAFTGLDEYHEIEGLMTVTWEAFDEDGDELSFELWYIADDRFHLMGAYIQGDSYEVDLSDYPGSQSSYFYIYATDGVRTAEAQSPLLNVQYTPPTILTKQTGIPKVKITEEIFFRTEIYDAQDGWLSGDSVSWTLEGEEVSITSVLQTWPYQLEPGIYTFTCTATNSAGMSAQSDFTFEIIDDESDLPDDWSRPEIVHALQNGYIIPLSRIDSPATRGQFADIMFMLFFYMNSDGLPYYNNDLVVDSGDDDYSEFLMAYLGIMEAPGGIFDPHRSLTHREALKIMYQTWELASNPGKSVQRSDYSENKALELFGEGGIFDQSENIYLAEEKLSKKEALVWISRMDMWVFPE